jgi:hypothetical protein
MHRIDNATAIPALPAPEPIGTPGFFTNGNRPTGLVPTRVDDNWLNTVQEEIATVVLAAGLQLSKTSNTQLYEAIQAIAYGANPDLSAYLPLSGGTLANPGNLVVSGGLTVALGMMATGGIRYQYSTHYHSFGWDSVTIHAYVDGSHIGSLVTSDYPGSITIRGSINAVGNLSAAIAIYTDGNINAGGSIVAAGEVHGAAANFNGALSALSFSTGGAISAGGNVFGAGGVFTGDVSAINVYSSYIDSTSGGRIQGIGLGGDTFVVGASGVGTAYCAFAGPVYWPIGCNEVGNFAINEQNTTRMMVYNGSGDMWMSGGTFTKTGGGGFAGGLDRRIMSDIAPYERGLATIRALEPQSYRYNGLGGVAADGRTYTGLIAQDMLDIMPEMVTALRDPVLLDPSDTEPTEILALDWSALTFVLVNAVKELADRLEVLEGVTGRPLPA